MTEKRCSICKTEKPLEDFYIDKRRFDGRQARCKKCDLAKYAPLRANWVAKQKLEGSEFALRWTYEHNRAYFENQRAQPAWREKKRERDAIYRLTLKGQANSIRSRGKRRAQGGTHDLTGVAWEATLIAFEHACAYCRTTENTQVDHFIPLKHGGNTVRGNVLPACKACNCAKSDKVPDKWCNPTVFARVIAILKTL